MGAQPSHPESDQSPNPRQHSLPPSLPRLGSQPSASTNKPGVVNDDFAVWGMLKSCCSATNQVNANMELKVVKIEDDNFTLKNNRQNSLISRKRSVNSKQSKSEQQSQCYSLQNNQVEPSVNDSVNLPPQGSMSGQPYETENLGQEEE